MSPLDEGSARRRDLYLTTHDNQKRHPCLRRDSNPQSQQAISHWDRQLVRILLLNTPSIPRAFRYTTELGVFWEQSSRPVLVRSMIKHSEHVGSTLLHIRRCRDSELRSDIRCSDIFSLLFLSTFWAKAEIMHVLFCHYCLLSLPHKLIILHSSCHSTLCYIR